MKDLVTRENKEQFEKWLPNNNVSLLFENENHKDGITSFNPTAPIYFYRMPFEMQTGIYLDYYDSLGLIIDRRSAEFRMFIWDYRNEEPEKAIIVDCGHCETTNDWYIEAFKKVDELVNKGHEES